MIRGGAFFFFGGRIFFDAFMSSARLPLVLCCLRLAGGALSDLGWTVLVWWLLWLRCGDGGGVDGPWGFFLFCPNMYIFYARWHGLVSVSSLVQGVALRNL